jgi:hypothetical protein
VQNFCSWSEYKRVVCSLNWHSLRKRESPAPRINLSVQCRWIITRNKGPAYHAIGPIEYHLYINGHRGSHDDQTFIWVLGSIRSQGLLDQKDFDYFPY